MNKPKDNFENSVMIQKDKINTRNTLTHHIAFFVESENE